MSVWFWNMYHCCRGCRFSYYKSLKMAWRARHGPDPKVIAAAQKAYRAMKQTELENDDVERPHD